MDSSEDVLVDFDGFWWILVHLDGCFLLLFGPLDFEWLLDGTVLIDS